MSTAKKQYKRITTKTLVDMKNRGEKISMLTAYDYTMAKIVDGQNKGDEKYIKMSDDFDRSLAFKTACDLVFKGMEQPSGYTEPLLHQNRLKKKLNLN